MLTARSVRGGTLHEFLNRSDRMAFSSALIKTSRRSWQPGNASVHLTLRCDCSGEISPVSAGI